MGYEITNEDGEVVADAAIETIERAKEEITRLTKELGKAGTENEELKAKLTEATLYAEDADKKIADLQKENEELKAAIQAQATMGSAAPVSEEFRKEKDNQDFKAVRVGGSLCI
jgi:predicted RNase H-like nuclease (RuvC/YqgF family)